MDWTTLSVIIGVVGGIISIVQGVLGIADRFQKRSAQAAIPHYPPTGATAPGGTAPARPMPEPPSRPAPIPPSPAPQPHAPTPLPGYAPAPQPGYAPATVQTVTPRRSTRRFGTHPWIGLGSGVYLIGYAVSAALGAFDQNSPTQAVGFTILMISGVAFYAVWIPSIVQVIRMRRWGWLVGIVLGSAFVAFIYGMVGPTERRA